MIRPAYWLPLPFLLLAASDQPWKDKPAAQWTEADAKQVLSDSPWSRQASLAISQQKQNRRLGRGMGRGGIGIGLPGIGIGMPGGYPGGYPGGPYPRGGGYPNGGGYPQGGDPNGRHPSDEGSGQSDDPQTVIVRWESALPVQEAQLKIKGATAPSIDSGHYAIVVTGLPARLANRSQMSEKELKGQAELKKEGKKFAKPSDVRVISRDDGVTIVYLFPRSKEIGSKDHEVSFSAHMGRYELYQTFYLEDMTYQGKLAL